MSAPWKVDAPKGYRWRRADVEFERQDGWLSGFVWGIFAGAACMIVPFVIWGVHG